MDKIALPLISLIALGLVACGTNSDPNEEPFPPPAGTYTTTTGPLSPRATPMAVGQPMTMTLENGVEVDFTVDAMTPLSGAECPSRIYDGPPEKQFLKLDLTLRTGDTAPPDYESLFSPFLWKVRGDDGIVIDDAGMDDDAYYCVIERGADLSTWETNSIYNISFAVPRQGATGTVILEPSDYISQDRFEMRY